MDETLAQVSGATIFTRLDANSGFWQIPLSIDSRLLTTFIIPYGRYIVLTSFYLGFRAPGKFPTENVKNPKWISRCDVPDGRCVDFWAR